MNQYYEKLGVNIKSIIIKIPFVSNDTKLTINLKTDKILKKNTIYLNDPILEDINPYNLLKKTDMFWTI